MEKVSDIIESIANEKGLSYEEVQETVSVAMLKCAKKIYGEQYEYKTTIDKKTKALKLFQKILVVENKDERLKEENEYYICLKDAKKIDDSLELGDELTYELSLENLGRTAVAILQKELEYHIQRLMENKIFEKYKEQIGQIVFGPVTRVDNEETTYIEIDEIRAILTRKNRIKGESFEVGNVVKSAIRKVFVDKSFGIRVELSRTTPKFLEALLKSEVPEIKDGSVIINASARIPGERAKVALTSIHPNIDAVGATVGSKGVRINAVSSELNGENIDCIEFSPVPEIFVSRALSPAVINSVKMQENKALVTLRSDQKSKAIGKSGINIRLASMLCGVEIELVETTANLEAETTQSNDVVKDLKTLFGDD